MLFGMRTFGLLAPLLLATAGLSGDSSKVYYEAGLQLLDQGKYVEAQEKFKAAIAENPGSPEIHNALGLVALQTGEPRSAATSFEKALELRPEDAKILYNLISAYLASNQPVRALQKTDQLLAGKTADSALYIQTGEQLSRFGHVAHAVQCFRAAEKVGQEAPATRLAIAKLLLEADAQIERDRADINRLETELRANRERPEPYFQLGLMSIKLGQFNRSLELLEPALTKFSNSAEIRLAYALACYFTGQNEKAEAAYKHLVRMRPESDQTYFALGNFYADVGKLEEASASFRKAAAKNPRNYLPRYMLGVVQFRLQNYSDSAASLEAALKLNGSHADSYFWLGKIHLLLGNREKARECLEHAVKLEPKHLGAYYQLGLLYARNGEKEKSKDAMEMQRQLNAQLHKGLIALRMP
jgi:tetratricopeptide (TPR) repeat protein